MLVSIWFWRKQIAKLNSIVFFAEMSFGFLLDALQDYASKCVICLGPCAANADAPVRVYSSTIRSPNIISAKDDVDKQCDGGSCTECSVILLSLTAHSVPTVLTHGFRRKVVKRKRAKSFVQLLFCVACVSRRWLPCGSTKQARCAPMSANYSRIHSARNNDESFQDERFSLLFALFFRASRESLASRSRPLIFTFTLSNSLISSSPIWASSSLYLHTLVACWDAFDQLQAAKNAKLSYPNGKLLSSASKYETENTARIMTDHNLQ